MANLPEGSIVFFLSYAQDVMGNYYLGPTALHKIATAANAPVYIWNSLLMSPEVIGGSVLDIEAIANEGAGMALRVLRGENPRDIPIREYQTDSIMLSQPQLERWRISAGRLPRGSRILYEEPTFWQQYKRYVIAALSIIAAQSLLIGFLFLERRRRWLVTQGLQKSEEQFRLLFENSKDAILIVDNQRMKQLEMYRGTDTAYNL